MGQRLSTGRESDVSAGDVAEGPPSSTLSTAFPAASPSSASSSSSITATASANAGPDPSLLSAQRPTLEPHKDDTVQQDEREGSVRLGDVVRDTLNSSSGAHDQEPSAHQLQPLELQSDDEDGGFPRVSSVDSFPSPPRNVKADDAHPLKRRSSMSRTPAPPKLSRFRPSMDIVQSPKSPQSGYLSSSDSRSVDSSSSSSDEDLVGSGEELVSDWLDEPEDAVLSPPSIPKRARHPSACSSVSSHTGNSVSFSAMHSSGGRNSNSSQHSMTGWASWLSSPDDVEEEEDADDEPVALTPFLRDNMPVYEVMRQVQLFRNLSQMQQEQVVRALKPCKFSDGEIIVAQGTRGSRFYMIAKGEAVVTKKVVASSNSMAGSTPTGAGQTQERMITHLRAGHYFGELALIYDDPRTATVRAVGDVELLYLTQEDFQHIGQVHLSLMLQQVPLLARLSAQDQDIVLKCLRPANFSDGEYIVHQGDEGTRFYMITRGEAIVSEKAVGPDKKPYEKELTRLYEGHVFGEMSLIYSEPRTASVRAVGQFEVSCILHD